jgi:hypothetical protein
LVASECTQLLAFGDANPWNVDHSGLNEERITLRGQVTEREDYQLSKYLLLFDCIYHPVVQVVQTRSLRLRASPHHVSLLPLSSVRHCLQVLPCRALHNRNEDCQCWASVNL